MLAYSGKTDEEFSTVTQPVLKLMFGIVRKHH